MNPQVRWRTKAQVCLLSHPLRILGNCACGYPSRGSAQQAAALHLANNLAKSAVVRLKRHPESGFHLGDLVVLFGVDEPQRIADEGKAVGRLEAEFSKGQLPLLHGSGGYIIPRKGAGALGMR